MVPAKAGAAMTDCARVPSYPRRGVTKIFLSLADAVVYHWQLVVGTSSRVANQSVSLGPRLRRALNDALGGSAASVLTVTFGLSYALLIFAGPLAPYLSYGVATTLYFIGCSRHHPRARKLVPVRGWRSGELDRRDDGNPGVIA